MYDKSKKTWSQRLKITKTEKSPTTTASITANVDTNATNQTIVAIAAANNANNVSQSQQQATTQQFKPTTPTGAVSGSATAMHLQALQLQQQQQQLNDYHNAASFEYLPSALSRSMKYAEPWIYGTVRGIPARPYHHYHHQQLPNYAHPHAAAIFAAHPLATAEAVAVVICSCPEYLNGTKRDLKKASICKKCKGSRLPLANIGGTMRLQASNSMLQATKMRPTNAATMRVVSMSKKSRPTILDPQKDPYDLMRRTRLLSPEPGASSGSKEKTRGRGKSASPVRGRTRTRAQLPPQKKTSTPTPSDGASAPDCWLVEDAEQLMHGVVASSTGSGASSRRSILRCNVNPYDLISISSTAAQTAAAANTAKATTAAARAGKLPHSQNEFMPPNDDFNVEDAALNEEAPPFAMSIALNQNQTQKRLVQEKATAMRRRESASTSDTNSVESKFAADECGGDTNAKLNYSNVQAIAGQRISLGDHKSTKKALIKQGADGRSCESFIVAEADDERDAFREHKKVDNAKQPATTSNQQQQQQQSKPKTTPMRPPRVKKQDSNDCSDNEIEQKAVTQTGTTQAPNLKTQNAFESDESITVVTVTPTQNIKSILKRPTPKAAQHSEPINSEGSELGANTNSKITTAATTKPAAGTITTTTKQRHNSSSSSSNGTKDGGTPQAIATTPTATAQFYIPLPQARKKVQFMVEDNIIHAVEAHHHRGEEDDNKADRQQTRAVADDTELEDGASTAGKLKPSSNYDYYSRKREQQKLLFQQQQQEQQQLNVESKHNSNAAQATLLAALQHDSDLVSSALNAAKPTAAAATTTTTTTTVRCNKNNDSNDDVRADETSCPLTNNNTTPRSVHYEDVLPPVVAGAAAVTKQQTQIVANGNNNVSNETRPLQDQCQDTTLSNTNTTTATATAAAASTSTLPLATATESLPNVCADDDNNNAAAAAAALKHASAAQTTTAAVAVAVAAGDYDDDAKQQQQQYKLQANVRHNDSNKQQQQQQERERQLTTTKTQSRNPIRRSHSERQVLKHKPEQQQQWQQPFYNANANTNTITTNTNNAIFNFKDTMALRIKSNRSSTRDLFNETSNSSSSSNMSRPRDPPPPPPPTPTTPMAQTLTVVDDATTKATLNATQTKVNSLSLSPADQVVVEHVQQHAQQTAATTANSKVAAESRLDGDGDADDDESKHQAQRQRNSINHNAHYRTTTTTTTSAAAATETVSSRDNKDNNSRHNATQQIVATNVRVHEQFPSRQHQPQQQQQQQRETAYRSSNGKQQQQQQQPQRTIVRVAPFNKTTSEVHRLKISHTDTVVGHTQTTSPKGAATAAVAANEATATSNMPPADDPYNAQKKTSILINGDDCYSTMNLSCDASTPRYQSSVVVADYSSSVVKSNNAGNVGTAYEGLKVTTTSNTVTINVSSPRSAAEELIYQHNKINTMLSRQQPAGSGSGRAIIPIRGTSEISLHRSASSTSSASTSSMTSISSNSSGSGGGGSLTKRGRTLIRLDYEKEKSQHPQQQQQQQQKKITQQAPTQLTAVVDDAELELLAHEEELLKILRNPVEAVKRNLVPHVCGRHESQNEKQQQSNRSKKMKEASALPAQNSVEAAAIATTDAQTNKLMDGNSSFIAKLLEDPTLSQVADGLETETVAELIENSLKRLKESRNAIDITGTKDSDDINRLISLALLKIKEERQASSTPTSTTMTAATVVMPMTPTMTSTPTSSTHLTVPTKEEDRHSNRGSISSANSFASAHNYEMFDFDANESDCYQSCSSEVTSAPGDGDEDSTSAAKRSKFYQMLVDATLAEIEMTTNIDDNIDDHHYESIRNNGDPIYEEIHDMPPPLPLSAPPLNDAELEKKAARSIFEGASKYDILSYLVDAKERGVVREEAFEFPVNCSNPIIIEEEACDTLSDLGKRKQKKDMSSRASILSDSSEDNQSTMSSLSPPPHNFICGGSSLLHKNGASSEIERNDSGVGSETSKSSRSKYQNPLCASTALLPKNSPLHLCEDCDGPVETQFSDSGILFAPLVCRKCGKKRVERKEIITEIVETEEKYGRDLQIILEEFCHPMLVAGLLTQEQLSAIFLNTEELLENNQTLAERMRDALDIALEQGDDDLLTVNIGRIFLDFTQMLHAFESYCVRQAGASLLLANLEKEKELLRIFLKVSQMENAVLRRMNLNSFLMVPVQRVTKYPLLLARLYKVTPAHLEGRDQLKQAQEKIELHLNHINQEAKDVPTKLWRRISSSSPNRRASCEIDMINIKLRKMAIDVLEWNHDEVRFAMEGKLLYTQPTDGNWKKARTIKLTPVNALLVTNGKQPSANYKAEKVMSPDKLNFPKHTGIREASLLVVKEKCGRYTLIREPLYLDRCIVCSEADWDDYFEVQEISSKDTFIFKAEDGVRTKQWYTQLQQHAQGMGAWRKRRNALANIMINGMLTRS